MGNLFESKQKTTSTQATKIPANFQNLMNRTIQFANEGLDTPFEAYQGPRIAELSANEQAGIASAGANAGMYQDLINMASMNNADMQVKGGVPTASDLDQFINPYVDYVLGNTLGRLQEQSDTNMTKIGSTAAMQGAFGGSRHGVLEGANLAELLKSAQEASANTYSDAFDKGMGNWFNSQQLRRGTISDALNIAQGGQAYNLADTNALMQTGLTERTRNQGVLDFAYSEFLREQQDPYTKAGFAGSVMQQYPTNLFTRTGVQESTQTPSPFSQIAGIGMAAAGLMTGNPAAAAGLTAGKAAITAPANGMNLGALSGYMPGRAKGGLIKGYKSGGKVKNDPIAELLNRLNEDENKISILPDDFMEGFLGEELRKHNEIETPPVYSEKDVPVQAYDFLTKIFGEHPELGATKRNYGGKQERRMQQFLRSTYPELSQGEKERQALRDKLTNTQYVEPPKSLSPEVEEALRSLLQEKFNTVRPDDSYAFGGSVGGTLGNILGGISPAGLATKHGTGAFGILSTLLGEDNEDNLLKKLFSGSYKKEEQPVVEEYGNGGLIANMMAQGGNEMGPGRVPSYISSRSFQEPNSIIYSTGQKHLGQGEAMSGDRRTYAPRPAFNWDAFIQRHGLNSFMTPQFPNAATPRLPSKAPDLSMFMQALQQKLSGQSGTTPRFAEGGPTVISGNKKTRKGGSRLLEDVKHDGSLEDITYLLDEYPDEEWAPTDNPFDGMTMPGLDVEDFEKGMFKLESQQNGIKSLNADTQAFGKYQFLPSTWNNDIKQIPKERREELGIRPVDQKTLKQYKDGDDELIHILPSHVAQQEVYRRVYLPRSIKQLEKAGVPITPQNLYVAHHFGSNAGPKMIKAFEENPEISMKEALKRGGYSDRTADEIIAKNRLKGTRATGQGYMKNISHVAKWGSMAPTNGTLVGKAEATPLDAMAAESRPHNLGRFTEDQIRQAMRKRGDKVFTAVQPDGRRDRIRPGPDLGEALSPLETVMGGKLPQNAEPNYLDSLLSVPVESKELDPLSRFVKGGIKPFQGGGYVKGYANGQIVETNPNAVHSTDEDVLYKFNQGQPSLWDFLSERLSGDPFDKLRAEKSPYNNLPAMSEDLIALRSGNGLSPLNMNIPDYGQGETTGATAFNDALEEGEPSQIAEEPMRQELAQGDALSEALREMIMQEMEDRKNRKESDENKLFGMNVNMPLIKMGLGILANSGYPNSAGEAIGKGILGTLEDEEQKRLKKQERDNNKLKELVNLRYMQAMVESMDPNIKMQMLKEKAVQDASLAKIRADAEFAAKMRYLPYQLEADKEKIKFRADLEAEANNPFGVLGTSSNIDLTGE